MSLMFGHLYSCLGIDILKFERKSVGGGGVFDVILRCLDVDFDLLTQSLPLITRTIDGAPLLLETKASGHSLILLQ